MSLKTKHIRQFGPVVGMLIAATLVALLIRWAWITRDGSCICVEPREIVGGAVVHVRIGNPQVYALRYRGQYQISGDECQATLYVTEAEYSRKLYRED